MNAIDFHTHAFPDFLAERAISELEALSGVKAHLDGTVAGLLRSMDNAGVEKSVVCSVATKPEQFGSILGWSKEIASERIIPFPSLHPLGPKACDGIRAIQDEGFKGIKLHPYHQDFNLDDARVFPLYERIQECGLILVSHTGFDFAFPKTRKADPERILRVVESFPELKFVASHFGSWCDWDEVRRRLLGKPIYMEISFSLELMDGSQARDFLSAHPRTHLLFGTDSPWTDQKEAVRRLRSLELGPEMERLILSGNAEGLLAAA